MRYADDYRKELFAWHEHLGDLSVRVEHVGNAPLVAWVSADRGYEGAALDLTAEECEEFAAKLLEAARVMRRATAAAERPEDPQR